MIKTKRIRTAPYIAAIILVFTICLFVMPMASTAHPDMSADGTCVQCHPGMNPDGTYGDPVTPAETTDEEPEATPEPTQTAEPTPTVEPTPKATETPVPQATEEPAADVETEADKQDEAVAETETAKSPLPLAAIVVAGLLTAGVAVVLLKRKK